MVRHREDASEDTPVRASRPRPPLPARDESSVDSTPGTTHEQLVDALRAIEGVVDVGHDPPNLHFKSRPFLHFHTHGDRTYADVRFEEDFEPVWASTPREREVLLARVYEHVERLQSSKRSKRGRSGRLDE